MYRPVLGRMVIVHFNTHWLAYVNTGIGRGMASERAAASRERAWQRIEGLKSYKTRSTAGSRWAPSSGYAFRAKTILG